MFMFTCFIFLTEYCEAHTGLEFLIPLCLHLKNVGLLSVHHYSWLKVFSENLSASGM